MKIDFVFIFSLDSDGCQDYVCYCIIIKDWYKTLAAANVHWDKLTSRKGSIVNETAHRSNFTSTQSRVPILHTHRYYPDIYPRQITKGVCS